MYISKDQFQQTAVKIGLPNQQTELFWDTLEQQANSRGAFSFSNVILYLGTLITLSAMTWFIGRGWEEFGGGGLLIIAAVYISLFLILGNFLKRKELLIPSGLFVTLAVSMIPLAIYGLQRYTGWWILNDPGHYRDVFSWIKGEWFFMELGTVIGGAIALYFYRFPFITAPIFFALWFMSMDITPLLFSETHDLHTERLWVSLWFGVAILAIAFFIDRRTKDDYAFWGYFFGMLSFWCGLTFQEVSSEWTRFIYLMINIGLIVISVLLERRVFAIYGVLGVFVYIGALFGKYFYDSSLFPFILSFIGVAVVFLGIWYVKNQKKLEQFMIDSIPTSLKKWLPTSRK